MSVRAVTLTLALLGLAACDADDPAETDAPTMPTDTGDTGDTGDCPEVDEGDEPPEVLDCDAFGADLVLTDSPDRVVDYVVECRANVGGTLSIEPGTVIGFGEDAGLDASNGSGVLDIEGDECNPVVLRGVDPTPGSWRGVFIDNNSGDDQPDNRIVHTEIRHAGGGSFNSNGDTGAIILWADNRLTLTDTVVAESASHGLNVTYGDSTLDFARNHFEDNAGDGVYADAEYREDFDSESTFSGNAHPVGLIGGAARENAVWAPLSAGTYVHPGAQVVVFGLTIEAGAVVSFDAGAGLEAAGVEAPFVLAGTSDSPVVLQGSEDVPGHWRGVLIDNNGGNGSDNRITFAEIRDGGGEAFNSNGDLGGLILWADNTLTLEDSTIANSADVGLNIAYGDSELTFARNHFENNTSHAVYGSPEYLGEMDGASTFVGNGGDHVAVFGGSLPGPTSIAALDVPYYVLEDQVVFTGHPLTIEAGADFVFEANAGLEVGGTESPLHVAGTATDRVIMRGSSAVPGHWRGILIDNNSDVVADNLIENLDLRHAGGGSFNSNGDLGALILWADNVLTLRDVAIEQSGDVGLNATYGGSTLVLDGFNSFTGNVGAPVFLDPAYASALQGTDVHIGNDVDYALLTEGGVSGDHTWEALDVPYRLTSVTEIFYDIEFGENSQWTVEAGAELVFESNTGIESIGDVSIEGAAGNPVVLRGLDATPGYWKGLLFEDPDDTSKFYYVDHAEIRDAGGGSFNSNGDLGGIIPWADTSLEVTNTLFANLGAPCAINSRYFDVDTDQYITTGSSTDASAGLVCDPDDL